MRRCWSVCMFVFVLCALYRVSLSLSVGVAVHVFACLLIREWAAHNIHHLRIL